VIRSYCLEHELAYGLVASKKSIQELVRKATAGRICDTDDIDLLRGWRGEAVGAMLKDILEGQATLRVAPGDGRRVLRLKRQRTEDAT
jgi:hypothetical protein